MHSDDDDEDSLCAVTQNPAFDYELEECTNIWKS